MVVVAWLFHMRIGGYAQGGCGPLVGSRVERWGTPPAPAFSLEKRERRLQFLAAADSFGSLIHTVNALLFRESVLRGQRLFDTLGPADGKPPQRLAPVLHHVPFLDAFRKARKSRDFRFFAHCHMQRLHCIGRANDVADLFGKVEEREAPAPSCPGSSDSAVLPFSTQRVRSR